MLYLSLMMCKKTSCLINHLSINLCKTACSKSYMIIRMSRAVSQNVKHISRVNNISEAPGELVKLSILALSISTFFFQDFFLFESERTFT